MAEQVQSSKGVGRKTVDWLKSQDSFGIGFRMKLDKEKQSLGSIMGSICSFLMMVVVTGLTVQKIEI